MQHHLYAAAAALLLTTTTAVAAPYGTGADLWLEATAFDYEEPGLMTQEGELAGAGGSYTFEPVDAVLVRFSGDYRVGGTDYDGQTQSGIPTTSEADDAIGRASAMLARRLSLPDGAVYLEGGLAVRDWRQDLKDGTTNTGAPVAGYDRGHRYYYLPLGATWEVRPAGSDWSWHLGARYQHVISGYAWAQLEGDRQRRFLMDEGYGVRVETGATRYDAAGVRIRAEAYLQGWSFNDSETGVVQQGQNLVAVIEPENETVEIGLRLGIGF